MKKRMFGFIFAAVAAVWLLPLTVFAQGTGMGTMGETLDHSSLTYRMYAYLKPLVQQVAAGELSSTVFEPDLAQLGLTKAPEAEISTAANTAISLLMQDGPYEMYWYDKTQGFAWQGKTLDDVYTEFSFSCAVLPDYQGADAYHVDPAKARATAASAERAEAIVAENAAKTDYEKLLAYRDAICTLTDYNKAAAQLDSAAYGEPWQLIDVFDDDPDTTVVCEGYSKAFQYLCDLSTFRQDITCYCVSGVMVGATAAGDHMWNLVVINGKSYLADVTNSDRGSTGQDGGLFLVGNVGSPRDGYFFEVGNATVAYSYDTETLGLFDASVLSLEPGAYTPPAPGEELPAPTATPAPTASEAPEAASETVSEAESPPEAEATARAEDEREEAPRRESGSSGSALVVVLLVLLVVLLVAGLAVGFVFVLKKLD